ncbi:MAG TPA: ABC transporter ATP-binding protein [Clostridiales bacterium]|nr:ABC transporter ATP-binding protein [Clostridiales bacterium]
MLIELIDIRKYYDSKRYRVVALDGVDLKIDKGELLAIMGKSGCGKSTLLHILGGLIGTSDGTYLYQGETVDFKNKRKLAEFRRNNVGFIVQDFALIKEKTIYDNVELPLNTRNLSKLKRKEMVNEMLEKVGLEDKIWRYPYELSGGEQQRVAIARALIHNPKLILADEPTGSLDDENQIIILKMLKEVARKGTTVVIATHDIAIARECNRYLYISDRKIRETELL